jgi:hypothetical protein
MYSAKGKYSKNASETGFVKEGEYKPFANEGKDELLAKDGNWAGYDNEPFSTRAISHVRCARQQ